MSILSILLIGVAAALLLCAITAKIITAEPKKANKSEKAEIMKRLLALSNDEHKVTGAQAGTPMRPVSGPRTMPKSSPRKTTTTRISQPLRSH